MPATKWEECAVDPMHCIHDVIALTMYTVYINLCMFVCFITLCTQYSLFCILRNFTRWYKPEKAPKPADKQKELPSSIRGEKGCRGELF